MLGDAAGGGTILAGAVILTVMPLAYGQPLLPIEIILGGLLVPLIGTAIVFTSSWWHEIAGWYGLIPIVGCAAATIFALTVNWRSLARIGLLSVTFIVWVVYAVYVAGRAFG